MHQTYTTTNYSNIPYQHLPNNNNYNNTNYQPPLNPNFNNYNYTSTVTYHNNNNNNYTYNNNMPENPEGGIYDPNALPSQAQQYYAPPTQQPQMGMGVPSMSMQHQAQPMPSMYNGNQLSNHPYAPAMGAAHPYAPSPHTMVDPYGPAAGVSSQTINVQVSVPHGQQMPGNTMMGQTQIIQQQPKIEEPVKSECCKSCFNVVWISFVLIYLLMGIAYFIAKMYQIVWLLIVSYIVMLFEDMVLVKVRDKHNEMCDCSSEPSEEGRVKAVLALLVCTLLWIIFASVWYAGANIIWGYIAGGMFLIAFLFGMYAASEPEDEQE